MKKVSIAFYSTFSPPGWKSEQLQDIVPKLESEGYFEKGYGIKRLGKVGNKALDLSIIPLLCSRVLRRLRFLPFIKDYYPYLAGEYLTGLLFKRKISADNSKIVYLKARPFSLIKACKDSGKFIILEFGEMHPIETRERLSRDYDKFGVKSEYIFTSNYAIDESLKSIELADLIIVLSNESKKSFIKNGVPAEKIVVINLSLSRIYSNEYDPQKRFAFICTAKHSFVKGTHNLLLAWRKAKISNIPLFLVGDISNDLLDFMAKYGPFDNVYLMGNRDIHSFYLKFNFFGVLNSLSEGCPRAVIEYLGYGFPVITSPVSTCDIVEHGKNGFIVNDEHSLIDALQFFAEHIEDYERFSNYARISAVETMKNSYSEGFMKIIRGCNAAS